MRSNCDYDQTKTKTNLFVVVATCLIYSLTIARKLGCHVLIFRYGNWDEYIIINTRGFVSTNVSEYIAPP